MDPKNTLGDEIKFGNYQLDIMKNVLPKELNNMLSFKVVSKNKIDVFALRSFLSDT